MVNNKRFSWSNNPKKNKNGEPGDEELFAIINPNQLEERFGGKAKNITEDYFPLNSPSDQYFIQSDDTNILLLKEQEYINLLDSNNKVFVSPYYVPPPEIVFENLNLDNNNNDFSIEVITIKDAISTNYVKEQIAPILKNLTINNKNIHFNDFDLIDYLTVESEFSDINEKQGKINSLKTKIPNFMIDFSCENSSSTTNSNNFPECSNNKISKHQSVKLNDNNSYKK